MHLILASDAVSTFVILKSEAIAGCCHQTNTTDA